MGKGTNGWGKGEVVIMGHPASSPSLFPSLSHLPLFLPHSYSPLQASGCPASVIPPSLPLSLSLPYSLSLSYSLTLSLSLPPAGEWLPSSGAAAPAGGLLPSAGDGPHVQV